MILEPTNLLLFYFRLFIVFLYKLYLEQCVILKHYIKLNFVSLKYLYFLRQIELFLMFAVDSYSGEMEISAE